MLLKVSAAWASKIIDCTLNGILNGCHGRCCKGTSFYPSKSNIQNGVPVETCWWLGDNGCRLADIDKPIKCLLYPFVINSSDTLVLHYRAPISICKECYNKGDKTTIENQRHNLELLFGEDIVNRMIDSVLNKQRDFSFRTSQIFDDALAVESELERNNIIPIKRSEYWIEKDRITGQATLG